MNNLSGNRNTILLALVLLMLAGVAFLENSALVVLILLGLLFLVRQFDNSQLQGEAEYEAERYEDEYLYGEESLEEMEYRQNRQAQADPVYRHALEAVERAGHNPDAMQVLAVDIGLMAYRNQDDEEPTVFRTWSLPDDLRYVQPFVHLRLPSKANGRIKFEIVDEDGNVVFMREETHRLERGRNFLTPAARMPIHDQIELDGRWGLRVYADDMVVADHRFQFSQASNEAVRQSIGEDGEINTELRAAMAESRMPKMSLDELLEYQYDEEENQQRRQSS